MTIVMCIVTKKTKTKTKSNVYSHSNKMLRSTYKRVYNCNGSQDALDAVVPLGLALAWYDGYTLV